MNLSNLKIYLETVVKIGNDNNIIIIKIHNLNILIEPHNQSKVSYPIARKFVIVKIIRIKIVRTNIQYLLYEH